MKFRVFAVLVLTLAALSATETAAAASPGATIAPGEWRTVGQMRRANRLRLRLQRRGAVDARRQARLAARSTGERTIPAAVRAKAERVFTLVNEAREHEGLPALTYDPVLERTAQAYAEDMAARRFFAHDDPDGRSPGERIRAEGYAKPACDCSWMFGTGENLAKGQEAAADAVRDWLASPGHRENILNPDFEDTGVGYHDGYWVQHFGVSKVLP